MTEENYSYLEETWEFALCERGDHYHFYDDDGDVVFKEKAFRYKYDALEALMKGIEDGEIPQEQMDNLIVQIMNSEIPYEWAPPEGVLVTVY